MDNCINILDSDSEELIPTLHKIDAIKQKDVVLITPIITSQNNEIDINKYNKRSCNSIRNPLSKFRKIQTVKLDKSIINSAKPPISKNINAAFTNSEIYPSTSSGFSDIQNFANTTSGQDKSIAKCVKESNSEKDQNDEITIDPVDIKRAKIIKQLEDILQKINSQIRRLEEADQSLEDMMDASTSYILLDRYKHKYVEVWNKLCRVSSHSSQPSKLFQQKITLNDGSYPHIRAKVTYFVNKTNEFPDYFDIQKIVEKCNIRFKLNISKAHMESIARDIFLEVGSKLQRRRKADFKQLFGCHLTDSIRLNEDPALHDKELQQKLAENHKISRNKIDQVIDYYANCAATGIDSKSSESSESFNEMDHSEEDDVVDKNKLKKFMNIKSKKNIKVLSASKNKKDVSSGEATSQPSTSDVSQSGSNYGHPVSINKLKLSNNLSNKEVIKDSIFTKGNIIQPDNCNKDVIICNDVVICNDGMVSNESINVKVNCGSENKSEACLSRISDPNKIENSNFVNLKDSIFKKKDLEVFLAIKILESPKNNEDTLQKSDLILSKTLINQINKNVKLSHLTESTATNTKEELDTNLKRIKHSKDVKNNKFAKILNNFDLTKPKSYDPMESELIITDLRTLATNHLEDDHIETDVIIVDEGAATNQIEAGVKVLKERVVTTQIEDDVKVVDERVATNLIEADAMVAEERAATNQNKADVLVLEEVVAGSQIVESEVSGRMRDDLVTNGDEMGGGGAVVVMGVPIYLDVFKSVKDEDAKKENDPLVLNGDTVKKVDIELNGDCTKQLQIFNQLSANQSANCFDTASCHLSNKKNFHSRKNKALNINQAIKSIEKTSKRLKLLSNKNINKKTVYLSNQKIIDGIIGSNAVDGNLITNDQKRVVNSCKTDDANYLNSTNNITPSTIPDETSCSSDVEIIEIELSSHYDGHIGTSITNKCINNCYNSNVNKTIKTGSSVKNNKYDKLEVSNSTRIKNDFVSKNLHLKQKPDSNPNIPHLVISPSPRLPSKEFVPKNLNDKRIDASNISPAPSLNSRFQPSCSNLATAPSSRYHISRNLAPNQGSRLHPSHSNPAPAPSYEVIELLDDED